MAKYSFKSSGVTQDVERLTEQISRLSLPPIGIKAPLELSSDGISSLFTMNYEQQQQVHENFRNMLLTNKGDRLGRHDFGASLREMTFDFISSENFEQTIMNRIKEATSKYMPFIELESFSAEKFIIEANSDIESMTKVEIIIEYNIAALGVVKKPLALVLYVGG